MGDLSPVPRTYPHGATSWVDLVTGDVDAAGEFYARLLGWSLVDVAPAHAPVRYVVATLDGLDVAAITGPGTGSGWSTYVAVDDADAVADRAVELGGQVLEPPADAGPGGRAATIADPEGAVLRLWQAGRRLGAQLANVPGAWNFSDLHSTDPEATGRFYEALFGWRLVDQGWGGLAVQLPGYGDHLAATTDPGIRERQSTAPEGFEDVIGSIARAEDGEPPHWHVTFAVADRDATTAEAERLGAQVVASREDDWTRTALLRDPQGAELTVSQFAPPDPEAWS